MNIIQRVKDWGNTPARYLDILEGSRVGNVIDKIVKSGTVDTSEEKDGQPVRYDYFGMGFLAGMVFIPAIPFVFKLIIYTGAIVFGFTHGALIALGIL